MPTLVIGARGLEAFLEAVDRGDKRVAF